VESTKPAFSPNSFPPFVEINADFRARSAPWPAATRRETELWPFSGPATDCRGCSRADSVWRSSACSWRHRIRIGIHLLARPVRGVRCAWCRDQLCSGL